MRVIDIFRWPWRNTRLEAVQKPVTEFPKPLLSTPTVKARHRCGRCGEGFSSEEKYLDHRCPKREYRTPKERYD